MRTKLCLAFVLMFVISAVAQSPAPAQAAKPAPPAPQAATPAPAAPAATMPAAKPEDVKSIDSIMAAVYDVISGPAGQPRDWDRFKSLFIPEGRLIAVGIRPDGTIVRRVMSVDEFAQRSGAATAQAGFFENEVSRKMEQYDKIAHVFSTYESRREKGAQPFARGINSFQLVNDGTRWYVVTIFWEGESPSAPIPAEFQKK